MNIQNVGGQEVDVSVIPADLFEQDTSDPQHPVLSLRDWSLRVRGTLYAPTVNDGQVVHGLQTLKDGISVEDSTGRVCLSAVDGKIKLFNISVITESTTLDEVYTTILVNTTDAVTLTLPEGLPVGFEYKIQRIVSSENAITVARSGYETIEGMTSISFNLGYSELKLTKINSTTWVRQAGAGIIESTPEVITFGQGTKMEATVYPVPCYMPGSGYRELFRVYSDSLVSAGRFTIAATRNDFIHGSNNQWISNHSVPPYATLSRQITNFPSQAVNIAVDVQRDGSVIISADFGDAQGYYMSIEVWIGTLYTGNRTTLWDSPSSGYTRYTF